MDEELTQLKKEMADLKAWKANLERSSTIPLNIDQSFRARFLGNVTQITTSSHGAENQAVNEAGAASYNVAKPADGFFDVEVNGVTKAIPYYD